MEHQVSDDERHDASWVPRFCHSSICVFGAGGVLAVAGLNGAGRGTGYSCILSACPADRLAEPPREEGSDEVERQP